MNVLTTRHAEPRRRADHLLQMLDDARAMLGIGIERIGIVAQAGDRDAVTS